MKKEHVSNETLDLDVSVGTTEAPVADEAAKLEAFKESKRAAAKRFKEKRAAEKEAQKTNASKLVKVLKDKGAWDKLDKDLQLFVENLANPTSGFGGGESNFTKMFGPNPTVGMSVTLSDAFSRTLKGKADIDVYIKKWAAKGIVVKFEPDNSNILNSKYVIESM